MSFGDREGAETVDRRSPDAAAPTAPLWASIGAAAALGAAMSWTQAPSSFYPLIFIVLPLVGLLFDLAPTARRAAIVGWSFGMGYFVPGLLWIGEAFFVEAERFAWLAPFAVTLLPAYLSLYWAAAFALARSLGGSVWALAGGWAAAEYLRAQLFTGFPWGLFAYSWVDSPVAQTAAWIGPFALNLATLVVGLALGRALIGGLEIAGGRAGGRRALRASASPASRAAWGAGAAALVVVGWVAGDARSIDGEPAMTEHTARIVQPNVPQTEKWKPGYLQRNFDRLMLLSEGPAAEGGAPDMVVWPETAVTPWVVSETATRAAMMTRLGDVRLVLGTQRWEGGGEDADVFNSLFALEPDGAIAAVYDKHHLVPFGEFLPFQDALEAIGIFQLAGGRGGFDTGPGPTTVAVPGLPSFGALICYEAIFPDEMPGGEDRPELLLQITNDAWFGDSGGPYQHLVQAQMRAIEQGLPFIRSANTGVSAAIDPYGRIYAELALNDAGRLDVRIAAPLPPTPYAEWGETPFFASTLVVFGLGLVGGLRRRAAAMPT